MINDLLIVFTSNLNLHRYVTKSQLSQNSAILSGLIKMPDCEEPDTLSKEQLGRKGAGLGMGGRSRLSVEKRSGFGREMKWKEGG